MHLSVIDKASRCKKVRVLVADPGIKILSRLFLANGYFGSHLCRLTMLLLLLCCPAIVLFPLTLHTHSLMSPSPPHLHASQDRNPNDMHQHLHPSVVHASALSSWKIMGRDQGVGARATTAQAAWQVPNAELQATMAAGAAGAATVPNVAPAAA